jgi:SAM-dependent methyltransferase
VSGGYSSIYPVWYTDWLFAALDLQSGDETEDAILEPIYALNRQWVGGASAGDDYADDAAIARAYALFYMTINMPKLWHVLDRCIGWRLGDPGRGAPLRVVEYGCGPGTFGWALAFYLQARCGSSATLDLTGVDRSAAMLDIARRLGDTLPETLNVDDTWIEGPWEGSLDAEADIAIFGNVLNEGSTDVAELLEKAAAPVVIVIEPGTLGGFAQLRQLRDSASSAGWGIAFPCTGCGDCPMVEDDWCHFSVNRYVLPFIQRICGQAKRLNPRHHFTAFVFTREPLEHEAGLWRATSKVRKVKRSAIRYLCNTDIIREVVLNRRAKTEANRDFANADAGAVLKIDGRPGTTGRLTAEDCCRSMMDDG